MKAKKTLACIICIALTFLSLCSLSFLNEKDINTVSAYSTENKYTECTGIECTIKNPDFIISENEQLNATDLKRHGIKINRIFSIFDQPPETIGLGELVYREEFGQYTEPAQLYECDIQFPQKLAEGKNTIHICNITNYYHSYNLECDLEINISFSEDSEKKDLHKRSETMFGDIDSSGEIDIKDLVTLSQFLLGDIVTLSAGKYMCADVTGDDEVNICDLAMLRQYIMNDDVDLGRTKKPDENIAFLEVYKNYAWTYKFNGVIYDKEGNEYNFDFSDTFNPRYCVTEIPLDRIITAYRTTKCNDTHRLNAENMEYMNSLINKLDETPEFISTDGKVRDFGKISYYAVKYNEDNEAMLIKVYSYGDVRYTPKDENAAELFRYYCKAAGISNEELLIYDTEDD